MDTRKNILIAIDRSDASLRAVAYVAGATGVSRPVPKKGPQQRWTLA